MDKKTASIQHNNENQEVGFVVSVRDFLIVLSGLPTVRINDIIQSENATAVVNTIYPDTVEAYLLTETPVVTGEQFQKTQKKLSIPVGEFLLTRAIDPLGRAIDNKPLANKEAKLYEVDHVADGVYSRAFIKKQFITGISMVDMLIPLGLGQRELVIGDARSGKTSFLIDLIVNQRSSDMICIYASIGKTITDVKSLIDKLTNYKALDHTIIVAAPATASPTLIYLAPFTAMTIAEYFQKQGKNVLLILDDLGNHAKMYREMSLLSGRSPGRDSYPGDIFYQHAHLLERAGNYNQEYGGGSITALPVIELNLTDFTSYIPTNLMSMTDGHLLFKASMYNQGQRPAIDMGLSVSRVGLQTQDRLQNVITSKLKQVLAQSRQLETISRFSSELPLETQLLLRQKDLIDELIRQDNATFIPKSVQIALFALPFTSFLKDKDRAFIKSNKKQIIQALSNDANLLKIIEAIPTMQTEKELLDKLEAATPILQSLSEIKTT